MKKILILFMVCFMINSILSQEKSIVKVTKYDVKYANLTINNEQRYKVLQVKKITHDFIIMELNNKEYKLVKVIRMRPLSTDFFDVNVLLKYYEDVKKGTRIIIIEEVNNLCKLKL